MVAKRTKGALMPYIAMVEGVERGVPFRVYMKRMDKAQYVAARTGARVTDLRTLETTQFIAGEFRVVQ